MGSINDGDLYNQRYYHGLLPREDIKSFLHNPGDFLVRMTEPSKPGQREYVISVLAEKEQAPKHFVINKIGDKFLIERPHIFDSVHQLVDFHISSKTSLTSKQIVVIKSPIGRRSWELDHEDIESTKKLGEGAFGEVGLCFSTGILSIFPWKTIIKQKLIFLLELIFFSFSGPPREVEVEEDRQELPCAIKLAKLDAMTKEQIKEIMSEARLMRFFDHPNIVRLYGVAARKEPLMLVMELANQGSLDSFLQKNAVSMETKNEMVMQSAWGIEYLHEKNCLHRDIAARNCLYGDNKVKIADFGLSRAGNIYQMDPKSRVPIRWLATETIKTAMYSQKTDVFSFGILVWEIYHNGVEPHPGMRVMEVAGKVAGEGYRMAFDPALGVRDDVIQFILRHVWSESPNERLAMVEIAKKLESIFGIPRPVFTPLAAAAP